MDERIELWTDGGANLHVSASFGIVLVHFKGDKVIKVVEDNGRLNEAPFTAPHAELTGCNEGIRLLHNYLEKLGRVVPVRYCCDATFVTNSLTIWGESRGTNICKWTAKEYGLKLLELYKWILEYRTLAEFEVIHVKAHSGIKYNERADQLASEALQ